MASTSALAQPASAPKASVEELDRQCYEARMKKLEPEREQLIQQCIKDGSNADYCKRYWRDYGEGGATLYGNRRRGKYFDLPICQQAEQARLARDRNTRGSSTGVEDRTDRSGVEDRTVTDGINRDR
jgi:hypothetical protein